MEITLKECIERLNDMVLEATKVLNNAEPTVSSVLKVQRQRKKLNDFLNGTPNDTLVKALRAYADGRNWSGGECGVGREVAEEALREVFKNYYSRVDIGDGKPVNMQMCPNCGIYPTNVDDCGNFGDYHCPYFGVGEVT